MANIGRNHMGIEAFFSWVQNAAAEVGRTPADFLFESDGLLQWLKSHQFLSEDVVRGWFPGGMVWDVRFVPSTMQVTEIRISVNDQPFYEWMGLSSWDEFVVEDWPVDVSYGSPYSDWLSTWEGNTVYAGAGDDLIESDVWGGAATIFGHEGRDAYLFYSCGNAAQVTLADYELGERLYFDMYDTLEDLLQHVVNVRDASAQGFTVDFRSPQDPHDGWSLRFEGVSLEQFVAQDLNQVIVTGVQGDGSFFAPYLSLLA